MTPEQRIKELKTRQVFYGSSMVIKLSMIDGVLYYTVFAWKDNGQTDNKFVVIDSTRYDNEDPNELFQIALLELKLKKIKLGIPIPEKVIT